MIISLGGLDPNRIEELDISYYFLQLFSIISSLLKRAAEHCSISLDLPLRRLNVLYVVEKKEKWKFKVWLKINESHDCQSGTASSAAYLLRALQFLKFCSMLVGWEKQQKKTSFKPTKKSKNFLLLQFTECEALFWKPNEQIKPTLTHNQPFILKLKSNRSITAIKMGYTVQEQEAGVMSASTFSCIKSSMGEAS